MSTLGDLSTAICLAQAPEIFQVGHATHGQSHGPSVDKYRLPDLWCLHIYQYEATLELDGHVQRIYPGTVSLVPPDTAMVYRYRGLSEHCYCHFRVHKSTSGEAVDVPAVQHVGARPSEAFSRFTNLAGQALPPAPKCQAVLWDLLWFLSEASAPLEGARHPALLRATRLIEQALSQPIQVSEIAKASGVSYSYMSRLFQAEFGHDVVSYIRQRRSERAEHLLRCSTLPIKSIATSVGMPDLAQFNRLIHRTHGCSPTALRLRFR